MTKRRNGDFLAEDPSLPVQGLQVQFLVRELRSQVPLGLSAKKPKHKTETILLQIQKRLKKKDPH